jgi:preprotein translocase subunit YajC
LEKPTASIPWFHTEQPDPSRRLIPVTVSAYFPVTLIAQAETSGSSILAFLFPILILGGLFYVLLILPQRRRQKKMEQLRSEIGVGDEIRTIGGILGRVVGEDDDTFTIDIGGSTMRVIKRAVAEKVKEDDE